METGWIIAIVAAILVADAILVLALGPWKWRTRTQAVRRRLDDACAAVGPATVRSESLADLPPPVQRYLRRAVQEGRPCIKSATIEHRGVFNMSESGERWAPFTSSQRVTIAPPGFDWDARISPAPFLPIHVRDAYVAGEGILSAALFGVVPVMNAEPDEDLARGELMRFLAEAPWYPTALLPGFGVTWKAADSASALATLRDGRIEVTLLYRFGFDGMVETVRAEARSRIAGKLRVATPWAGSWRSYVEREGMRVPSEGEVAWVLPEGPRPYWRGTATRLTYDYR